MSGTMKDIEKSGEFKRIPLSDQSKDELQVMGAAFNRMMERLERNYNQQQQFLTDASHELKTLITVIESYLSIETLGNEGSGDSGRGSGGNSS
ncbi:hypothetical protein KEH51_14560 [[Brevibacterium] frigoritolerans]|uniref:histidine kinase n=1 Tax=Peribacillus frigoritolerans TaxID=450367 RepID=A0A941FRY1_9BACI|nr:hypothetical protein [Peribacillus frigoritolerans]